MGWADNYINMLKQGQTIQFRPRGNSMSGLIESGDLVEVEPVTDEIKVGDIVLCRVHGTQYLHLVKAVKDSRVQIGNNRGHINGWTSRDRVYGRFVGIIGE